MAVLQEAREKARRKVIRADVLGFCMGVKRAVRLAEEQADGPQTIYALGELIHNRRILESLERRGVRTIPDGASLPENLQNASVVVRAHGISPEARQELIRRGAKLADATCPKVKASQVKTRKLAESGHFVFLAGEESHAEIVGIVGHAELGAAGLGGGRSACVVVGNAEDAMRKAAALVDKGQTPTKTALVAQSTISEAEYTAIAEVLRSFFPDIQVVDTICGATTERQASLRKLLEQVQAAVIVGSRESANARRLLAVAETSGKPSVLAETAADIPPEFLDFAVIGITAGASTPESLIVEIEEFLLGRA